MKHKITDWTARDEFAAKIVQGLMINPNYVGLYKKSIIVDKDVCVLAYKLADEMIKVRKNKQP